VSNDDREPPEESIADSLKEIVSSNYSAYIPALEASQTINDKVVRDIVERWPERQSGIPHTP
jgi:purine nucleoside permease